MRYLHDFTPEHQQLWKQRQLSGSFVLHPDYYRASIQGQFPQGIYIYRALLYELRTINDLFKNAGLKPLFKQDFADNPPSGLAILLRPTRQQYTEFAILLDKILSDNINMGFFPANMPRVIERKRKDGRVVLEPRGSISLLESWMQENVKFDEPQGPKRIVDGLRAVRSARTPGAHKISADSHDPQFLKSQRELIKKAYRAVKIIRDMAMFFPENSDFKLPSVLSQRLWTI